MAIGACGGGGGIGGGLRGIGGGVGDGGCTLTTSPAQERVREPACKMGAEQHVEEHGDVHNGGHVYVRTNKRNAVPMAGTGQVLQQYVYIPCSRCVP